MTSSRAHFSGALRRWTAAPFNALIALLVASPPLHSQPAPLDVQLAREPAIVATTTRREFRGLLDGFRDGRLFLRVVADGGEVGYSFAPAEIATLTLPGAGLEAQAAEWCDRGDYAEALPLLEALGRQRLRYLPLLTPAQRRPLHQLLAAAMRAGNPLTTLGYVNQLRPQAGDDPAERALLRDAELDAHMKLGHTDEVRRLAVVWCAEADPAAGSALGWMILARLAYDDGDFDRARWIALQPAVFASFLPTTHLDTCYALALASAHRLGDFPHAAALHREMRGRGLAWPDEAAFAAIGTHYARLADQPIALPAPPLRDDPAAVPPAPATERRLQLDQVRRLVAPPRP